MPARALVIFLGCLLLHATNTFQLTVDSIMRGPALTGYEPRATGVRWAGNGERLYFEWKLATDPLRADFDTYAVNRDGSGLRKLTREEEKLIPPSEAAGSQRPFAGVDTTKDRRLTVYSREGDIYVYDRRSDQGRRIMFTAEAETNPQFLRDGKRIAFTRSNNLLVMALDGASVVQMTDIQPPGAPVPPEEKKGTASQEYLKKEERALLETVKEKALKREEDEANKKKDNPRKPLRLAARQTVTLLQLSPDEKTVTAIITESAEATKTAVVPAYVTESAYTETLTPRPKVGDASPRRRMALIDAVSGEVKYVDTGLKKTAPVKPETKPMEAETTPATSTPDEKKTAPQPQEREVILSLPHWSEDGTKAFITGVAADRKDWWLFALDRATGKTRTLATVHDEAWVNSNRMAAGWLKSDRDIFFLSEQDGYFHLYSVTWDGGPAKHLTFGRWEILTAELSHDKTRFYLETNEEHPGERHLYVMDAAGGARTRLTRAAGEHQTVLAPDERSAADVYSYVNKPPELFLQDLDITARPVKVTNSPLPEFWTYDWQDAPIVQVPARDGAQVPGRLYKPRQWRSGGPAVIFVHGAGYLQNVHKGWSNYYREYMFHHLLMERGYTVLDIDYRGSANYGRDWRTAIYRHMGGKDLDDHLDAAKWLVAQHGVDPKRIGIYGGSYGGFMTLMALFRHPDVFAAGAALRPVTDWAHYNHGYTSGILNTPQEDAEAYKRSSPIYFADGLRGALLLCHGMADVNVHVQDTIRLAQRLIELRKENWEMALYPVEDHAFVQPTSWADEYKRILKLFETNLKPAATPAAAPKSRKQQPHS